MPKTQAEVRRQWHSLVRGWRNRYMRVKNVSGADRYFEYFGNAGATIPAGATVEIALRRPVSYSKAVKYHNMMEADFNSTPPVLEEVSDSVEPDNSED